MSQMILLLRNNPGLGPNKKNKEMISNIEHQHLGFQCMLHSYQVKNFLVCRRKTEILI